MQTSNAAPDPDRPRLKHGKPEGLANDEIPKLHGFPPAMQQAVAHDPNNWETHYSLALAQASAGVDPRTQATLALRLNPLEPLTEQAAETLDKGQPPQWPLEANQLIHAGLATGTLSITPQ